MEVKVIRQVMEWNENCHKEIQEKLNDNNVYMLNVMGSPGAGKTTFILAVLNDLRNRGYNVGVIEGDIEGTIDAERMLKENIKVVQLNTGGSCHIEAMSIKNILPNFNLKELDVLVVENIGNLVCPAEFDIGEHLKVAMLSVPEGSDKVVKYPLMFTKSDALVLSKMDLINHFDFNIKTVFKEALARNENIKLFKVNSKNDEEVSSFVNYIEGSIANRRSNNEKNL